MVTPSGETSQHGPTDDFLLKLLKNKMKYRNYNYNPPRPNCTETKVTIENYPKPICNRPKLIHCEQNGSKEKSKILSAYLTSPLNSTLT